MLKYFIELGANVIITSRREELLIEVAKEFNSKHNSEVFPIACDVRKIDEVENVINESLPSRSYNELSLDQRQDLFTYVDSSSDDFLMTFCIN